MLGKYQYIHSLSFECVCGILGGVCVYFSEYIPFVLLPDFILLCKEWLLANRGVLFIK